MALIRSLSLDAPSSAHQGAGLVAARADWQRALDQAREEGRRLGREESAAAVRTAQAARERSVSGACGRRRKSTRQRFLAM